MSQKQSIVSLFLERFTLTDDEIEALTSGEVPIGTRFFAAMDKAHRIRDDCRVLMSGEERPSQAGCVAPLHSLGTALTVALQGGHHGGHIGLPRESLRQDLPLVQLRVPQDGPRCPARRQLPNARGRPPSARAPRAAHVRVDPPLSFLPLPTDRVPSEAFATLSQTRQSALLSAFLDALTRGGPSGLPRPIELHAHDALRYVGDMLAWVHQAIAAERELLEGLFGLKGDGRMVGSVRAPARGEEEEWIAELMDSAVAKLCVPLKVRFSWWDMFRASV